MTAIERPSRCPHCKQLLPGTSGIPLAEAVERYGKHWGHQPEPRWISAAARRLGCYQKIGKRAFIMARHWDKFLEEAGKWGSVSASESIVKRTGRGSSTRDTKNRIARKTERSDTDPVKEALAMAKG